jgi:hypothetical protein
LLISLPDGTRYNQRGGAARPRRRKRGTCLGHVCVCTDNPITMRRVPGSRCGRIFRPRDRKRLPPRLFASGHIISHNPNPNTLHQLLSSTFCEEEKVLANAFAANSFFLFRSAQLALRCYQLLTANLITSMCSCMLYRASDI